MGLNARQVWVLMREPSVLSIAIGATDCINVATVSACAFGACKWPALPWTTFASFKASAVLVLLMESMVVRLVEESVWRARRLSRRSLAKETCRIITQVCGFGAKNCRCFCVAGCEQRGA